MEVKKEQITCSESWKRWYENKSPEERNRWLESANKIETTVEDQKKHVKLSSSEEKSLRQIITIDDFIALTSKTQEAWTRKKGAGARDMIQKSIEGVQEFTKSWDSVISSLLDIAPFGSGKLAWGLVGMVLTSVEHKHTQEKILCDNLSKISKRLPRIDLYNELYATDRMANFVSSLYTSVMKFLWEMFVYFKRSTRGIKRFWWAISHSPSDIIEPLISEIEEVTMEIYSDGQVGVCAEVRGTKVEVEKSRKDIKSLSDKVAETEKKVEERGLEIAELKRQLTDAERKLKKKLDESELQESKKDLQTMKPLFVSVAYDSKEILQKAMLEITSIPRSAREMQGYSEILQNPEIQSWYKSTTTSFKTTTSSRVLWIYSANKKEGISQVVLELLEFPSFQSKSAAITTSFIQDDTLRTGRDIFKECIYQLLLQKPTLVRSNVRLDQFRLSVMSRPPSMLELADLLKSIIQAMGEFSRVFWIIDRFDNISFEGKDSLGDVLDALRGCVEEKDSKLRILLVSKYAPEDLDRNWDCEDMKIRDESIERWASAISWKF